MDRKNLVFDVFRDFCELSACSISNAVDKRHYDEREANYMGIVKKYGSDEAAKFAEMLGCLINALDGFGP